MSGLSKDSASAINHLYSYFVLNQILHCQTINFMMRGKLMM